MCIWQMSAARGSDLGIATKRVELKPKTSHKHPVLAVCRQSHSMPIFLAPPKDFWSWQMVTEQHGRAPHHVLKALMILGLRQKLLLRDGTLVNKISTPWWRRCRKAP